MRYIGLARRRGGNIEMPDNFSAEEVEENYEVVEVGGDLLLMPSPIDRERLALIEKLARLSIQEHRSTLEGLAR